MENQEKQQILRLIKKNGDIRKTCKELDIHHTRYYRACDKDPVFKAKALKARTDYMLRNIE